MQVTVLGAGSWGTTVASLTSIRNPTLLWARDAAVADEVNRDHTNKSYLPGFAAARPAAGHRRPRGGRPGTPSC